MQPRRTRRRPDPAQWLLPFVLLAFFCPARMVLAAVRVITDADKGATVQLNSGEKLEVRLKSNPTTGYLWSVLPESTPLLKLTGKSETEPVESGVGRPIVQIFKFKAARPGDGVLLLHYVRSWEKPAADEERFDLHVSIR